MIKVLNLYAGIGGNRKLWENVRVTAVELDEKIAGIYKDFFPDDAEQMKMKKREETSWYNTKKEWYRKIKDPNEFRAFLLAVITARYRLGYPNKIKIEVVGTENEKDCL